MKAVKTNELKKGTRVRLSSGWFATLEDNKRGNIRFATVEGIFTEMGSIYSHDIVAARVDGVWFPVEHTDSQKKLRRMAW